jgi:arabinogalactan endo-1,4-beta-galactosidase
MENGEEGQEHVAFVQIDELPEYSMCLLKKGIVTNDDEIYETVKETGVTYYRYYAIVEDDKEKTYLASFDEAEDVIQKLKDKESTNSSKLTIVEKYETELPDLTSTSKAVSSLYKKKVVVATTSTSTTYSSSGSSKVSTSRELSNKTVNLGITLIKPVSGVLAGKVH